MSIRAGQRIGQTEDFGTAGKEKIARKKIT